MRQYLFRGKRVDNGEWVEGELLHKTDGKPYIFTEDDFAGNEVLPETVGQWTGLYDKNKARIWEGDYVKCVRMADSNVFDGVWRRNDEGACVPVPQVIAKDDEGVDWQWPSDMRRHSDYWEVIGNIHDTPSLLNDKT